MLVIQCIVGLVVRVLESSEMVQLEKREEFIWEIEAGFLYYVYV